MESLEEVTRKKGEMDQLMLGGFPAFTTAGGRKVTVSEKAIAAAKNKFMEDGGDDDNEMESESSSDSEANGKIGKEGANLIGGFPAFTTAGGRKVAVSEKAIAAAKNKFMKEEGSDLGSPEGNKEPSLGGGFPSFTTAGGRKVAVSEKAIAAAKSKFMEEEGPSKVGEVKPPLIGGFPAFTTAGGRKVTVSEKAIAAAKNKFMKKEGSDMDRSSNVTNEMEVPSIGGFPAFTTAGGRKVTVSEKAIAAAKNKFLKEDGSDTEESSEVVHKIGEKEPPLVGGFPAFTTAGGKKVTVSEKAIAAAKNMFLNEAEDEASDTESSEVRTVRKKISEMETFSGGGFPAFTTAGGKKVTVSEKAIAAAKNKFMNEKCSDMDESSEVTNKISEMETPLVGGFPAFTTAGGRKVTVSEKSIAAAKNKFMDEQQEGSPLEPPEDTNNSSEIETSLVGAFPAFSTAAGRKVTISEKSIAAAKNKFMNEEESDPEESSEVATKINEKEASSDGNFPAFATAGGRKIKLSEKAIAEAKSKLLKEEVPKPRPVSPVITNSPDPNDEISLEIEESTRLLLEDAESDDDSQWAISIDAPSTLASIIPNGQLVPSVKLAVVRVYPIVYCADGDAGSKIYFSEGAFRQRSKVIDLKTEKLQEKLLPEIQQKVRDRLTSSSQNLSKLGNDDLEKLTAEQLLRYVLSNEDGSELCCRLSLKKQGDLQNERIKFEEKVRVAVQGELTERMKSEGPNKRSSAVLKVRVVDCDAYNYDDLKADNGIISIWNPTEEVVTGLEEGHLYEFSNIKPNSFQPFQEIKLSSTKETKIMPVAHPTVENNMSRKLTTIQDILSNSFKPAFSELDTVGLVVKIDPHSDKDGQNVELSDQFRNILKVKFWTSLEDSGLEEVLKVGSIVACCNLQWRMTSSATATAFAQDISIFLVNPKLPHLRDGYNDIRAEIEGQDDLFPEDPESSLNISNLSAHSTTSTTISSRKRLSETRLFRFPRKRLHSELEDSLHNSSIDSTDSSSNATPKRRRVSKKFVPPRRLSPSPKT